MSRTELYPVFDESNIWDADKPSLISRYAPWDHYVKPLLKGPALLRKARPEVVLRATLVVRAGSTVFRRDANGLAQRIGF